MSTIKEIVDRNKNRRKSQVKEDIAELVQALMTANELMFMVQEWMDGQGIDTEAVPMMFYPEALTGLIFDKMKEAGVFEGIPATVKYVQEDTQFGGVWKKVEL